MWFLANLQTDQMLNLPPNENIQLGTEARFEYENGLLKKYFSGQDFLDLIDESFQNAVSILSKKLWTIEGKDPHYKPPIERHNVR